MADEYTREAPMSIQEARQSLGVLGNAARAWARLDGVLEAASIAEGWLEGYVKQKAVSEAELDALRTSVMQERAAYQAWAQQKAETQADTEQQYNEIDQELAALLVRRDALAFEVLALEERKDVAEALQRQCAEADAHLAQVQQAIGEAQADFERREREGQARLQAIEERMNRLRAQLAS